MGVVKRDINLRERQLQIRYKLADPQAVKRLLSNYDDLYNHRYFEGEAYCDILMDIDKAMELAKLTEKQKLALKYGNSSNGYTWEEASKLTGMSVTTLRRCEFLALRKIASVFEYWGNVGEGYEAVVYHIIEPAWSTYNIPTENGSYITIKHGKGLHVK